MDLHKLFRMQSQLDERIENEHGLSGEDLVEEKILALLVELGELANETRCFKFWSKKPPADRETILEEYVDGVHFILSIGNDLGNDRNISLNDHIQSNQDLVNQFLIVFDAITLLKNEKSEGNYLNLFYEYFHLGKLLQFLPADIEKAYIEKNEINHQRQDQGY